MECKTLFSHKNKKTYFKVSSAKIFMQYAVLQRVIKIKHVMECINITLVWQFHWVSWHLFSGEVEKCEYKTLTLKTPRKPASENVVCLYRLLDILANFSNLVLHTGEQCGPRSDCSRGGVWSLGPHCLQKWLLKSQADDKADDKCCDWQFKG